MSSTTPGHRASEGRKHIERRWNGLVGGTGPQQIIVIGSALHFSDLIHTLRRNQVYQWRRYSAPIEDTDRLPVPG